MHFQVVVKLGISPIHVIPTAYCLSVYCQTVSWQSPVMVQREILVVTNSLLAPAKSRLFSDIFFRYDTCTLLQQNYLYGKVEYTLSQLKFSLHTWILQI